MAFDSGKTGAKVVEILDKADSSIESAGVIGSGLLDFQQGSGEVWRLRGSDIGANAANWNFGVESFDVNGVGEPENNVVSFGWNVNSDGAAEVSGSPALRVAMEENYLQGGVNAYEFHLESRDPAGSTHRFYTAFLPRDGGAGSGVGYNADKHIFGDFDAVVKIQYNFADATTTVDHPVAATYRFENNIKPHQQRNAGDTAYLNMPYINGFDALVVSQPTQIVAPIGSGNRVLRVQATDAENNDILINCASNNVTGLLDITNISVSTSSDLRHYVQQNGAGRVMFETLSLSAVDHVYKARINGGQTWSWGLDATDNAWKVSGSAALGTDDRLTLSADGDLSASRSFKLPSYTTVGLPSASTLGAGAMVFVTDTTPAAPAYSDGTNWRSAIDGTTL